MATLPDPIRRFLAPAIFCAAEITRTIRKSIGLYSEGKRIKCIEKDGEEWTGIVDVYETVFDNADDEQQGYSICVSRDDSLMSLFTLRT